MDATYSPVSVGDLLTTSDTPGHAMKVDGATTGFGAVVGKALGSLACGRGSDSDAGLAPIELCREGSRASA